MDRKITFEDSQYLLRYASDLKGGLEYIDFSKDARKINEGDHLVYLGPNGERIAKYLEKLGYVVNISSIDEVIEKYKISTITFVGYTPRPGSVPLH